MAKVWGYMYMRTNKDDVVEVWWTDEKGKPERKGYLTGSPSLVTYLRTLGRGGWELVTVTGEGVTGDKKLWVFKSLIEKEG